MTVGNDYRKGSVDTLIKIFGKHLDRLEKKLDDNIEWQRSVDARLASGNTRFESLGDDVKTLKKRDGVVTFFSAIVATIAGVIGSKQ